MKIDVISIFPEYLAPLELSLLGKAQDKGLLEINVHDLRAHTSDNHHSVDDTPYGGGAGMVMKAQIWGDALDNLITDNCDLIILTPGGKRFNQRMAEELSTKSHLLFACGRYEGIDDRVRQHYSTTSYRDRGIRVHEISIGDYVLGGGEVASMVIIEAVTRLIPGVLGNPASIVEESHMHEGFAEYPAFTKPQTWRDISVPEILLSGNHAQIAAWRTQSAKDRAEKNF